MSFALTTTPAPAYDAVNQRMVGGLVVSIIVHALLLSLQFGIPGLSLPTHKSPAVSVRLASTPPPVPEAETAPLYPVPASPQLQTEPAAPRHGMTVVAPQHKSVPPVRKAPALQKKAIVSPRKSTPLPALEESAVATRVIAQDSAKDSKFNVPVPVPPEAEQKVIDKLEAQAGSDTHSADTAGVERAEAERLAEQVEARKQEELLAARQAEQAKAKRLADAQAQERLQAARQREFEALELKQRERQAADEQVRQQAALRQQQEEAAVARKAADEQARLQALLRQQQEEQAARKVADELAVRKAAEQLAVRKELEERAARKAADELVARKAAEEVAARKVAENLAARKAADELAARQQAEQRAAAAAAEARVAQAAAEAKAAQEAAARQQGQQSANAGTGSGGVNGSGNVARPAVPGDLASRLRDQVRGLDILRGTPPPPQANDDGRRRLVAGRIERDIPIRMYAESWRQKIERNGALNYSQLARERARNDPLVSVAIRSDGSVEDVTIVQSSGRADLDEAVRRIVRVNARYSAFPPAIAAKYDVIVIRRVWRFDETLQLIEEAQ